MAAKVLRILAVALIHVGTWLAYPGLLLNQWANRLAERSVRQ